MHRNNKLTRVWRKGIHDSEKVEIRTLQIDFLNVGTLTNHDFTNNSGLQSFENFHIFVNRRLISDPIFIRPNSKIGFKFR
ncbi:hypothetical protein LEP1GSC088_2105 [Leptospira interrogans str. L1207]|nr:hypothetical protein LEP1GSC053_2825 [Leptospira interrogans serovar Muenchen str. Brem 129]EMN49690.1 hypothetical protein LEP1GSC088_2105 [Leptospira interrogans str. L1207]EMN55406.1 hypothetical protein LEP1GSC089_3863 [Leptospira interrogans serovar Autumnalis str. LP101]